MELTLETIIIVCPLVFLAGLIDAIGYGCNDWIFHLCTVPAGTESNRCILVNKNSLNMKGVFLFLDIASFVHLLGCMVRFSDTLLRGNR